MTRAMRLAPSCSRAVREIRAQLVVTELRFLTPGDNAQNGGQHLQKLTISLAEGNNFNADLIHYVGPNCLID